MSGHFDDDQVVPLSASACRHFAAVHAAAPAPAPESEDAAPPTEPPARKLIQIGPLDC